jgi:hypothetical protein
MRLSHKRTRLFAIIILIALIELATCHPVHAAPAAAIILYDHGLAKQFSVTRNGHFVPINKTSTFTQDDSYVRAYFTATLSSANITWQWYDPTGQLYRERTDQDQCTISPCFFLFTLTIADNIPVATSFGLWTLDVLANGFPLYSDHFTLIPIITQENHWDFNVVQSATSQVHGNLTVIIHPNNGTWTNYKIYMPYAANVTAFDLATNQPLNVTDVNSSIGGVITHFGAPRSDGFAFVLSFDVRYGLLGLSTVDAGNFAFTWREQAWMRFNDAHPVPETFHITLPYGATFIDMLGYNTMALNGNLTGGVTPSISFTRTLPPRQDFGWTAIYRDPTWRNAHPNIILPKTTGVPEQLLPVLPLTLGSVSLWTVIMSVFLLTGSELLSPIYTRTGILINRRRLRIAALILVTIFLVTTAYRLLVIQSVIPR